MKKLKLRVLSIAMLVVELIFLGIYATCPSTELRETDVEVEYQYSDDDITFYNTTEDCVAEFSVTWEKNGKEVGKFQEELGLGVAQIVILIPSDHGLEDAKISNVEIQKTLTWQTSRAKEISWYVALIFCMMIVAINVIDLCIKNKKRVSKT